MRRLILGEGLNARNEVRISGKDCRYLTRVLRLSVGDRFRALLPDGRETSLRILALDPEGLLAASSQEEESKPLGTADAIRQASVRPLPRMVLLQALPKGQKMDLIVRQATEAGVSRIVPFIAERSVSRPEGPRDLEVKRERWTRIVKEARQQSGSGIPTEVSAPLALNDALAAWRDLSAGGASVGLVLHQDPLAHGTLHGYLSDDPSTVAVAVGPEGGFSPAEIELFTSAAFWPVILGANILRTETAAVFALAAIQVILLENASWMLKTPDSPESNEYGF